MRRPVLALMMMATAVIGCGRRSVPTTPAPSVVAQPVRVDPLTQPWRLEWRPQDSVVYRIAVTAELLSESGGRERVDSVSSELEVALATGGSSRGQDFGLRVLRYATRAEPDTAWRAPIALPAPVTLQATTRRGAIPELCRVSTATCTPELLAAAQGWQELWLGDAPDVLRPNAEWMDSTESRVIRDSIPLRIITVRRFRATNARVDDRGRVIVQLLRHSTAQLSGEGRQFGELIRLSGNGEGDTVLEVALPNGEIVSGNGRAVLRIDMEGRRRKQRLEQRSETEIAVP